MSSHLPHSRFPANSVADRVIRLSRAGWAIRKASGIECEIPFAFALFTDDRRHPALLGLLAELPHAADAGSIAVVFRHDHLPEKERMALAAAAMAAVKEKGHLFLMARGNLPGADGCHGHSGEGIVSMPIHSLREGMVARKNGANLGFVSPVFKTKSHADRGGIGPVAAASLARPQPFPCFALGGIDFETIHRLKGYPFAGIGAIGAVTDEIKT